VLAGINNPEMNEQSQGAPKHTDRDPLVANIDGVIDAGGNQRVGFRAFSRLGNDLQIGRGAHVTRTSTLSAFQDRALLWTVVPLGIATVPRFASKCRTSQAISLPKRAPVK